jgi:hypothetical protein
LISRVARVICTRLTEGAGEKAILVVVHVCDVVHDGKGLRGPMAQGMPFNAPGCDHG